MSTEEFKDATGSCPEAFRVGVRPPPFWPEEPALWFAQMEGQFILSNITADSTKFYYIIAQLDHRYAAEVKEIITNPPADNKYETLKAELVKRLSASRQRKLQQLLKNQELGDRKPSQFLRHLKDLAGSDVTDEFLKTMWTDRLPSNVQTVVISQSELPLNNLADIADKVHEIAPMSLPQVASTSAPKASTSVSTEQFEEISKQISELKLEVAKINKAPSQQEYRREYRRPRSASRGRRSLSRPRMPQPPPDHPHCWYHYTFGARANKCQDPCTWESENARSSRK